MEPLYAVCALDCAQCEARIATQANDEAAKERIAAQWRVAFNAPSIDVAYVTCDGCLTPGGRLGGHCLECDLRACGVARGLPTCAHCADYDTCEKLGAFLRMVPQHKAVLDGIRSHL